jgi:hypothetical protein
MNSIEAPRANFNRTLNNSGIQLMYFNRYMNLYDILTVKNKARSDAEELLEIAMLEYLIELDIQGHSQITLFFLRQELSNCKKFILSSLP